MKIFLAEDNEDNYLVVKSNLRKLEMDVELLWAKDGEIGIEMLSHIEKIDIFLVDIAMPNIDGIELAQWIRTQDRFINVPIVAITASVFANMKKMYVEKGFDYILEKPFERKELVSIIKKILDRV